MKRGASRLLLIVLLSVLLYGAVVAVSGYDQIRDSLSRFRWSSLAAALTLASLNYGLRFCKWQYYLRRVGVRGVKRLDSLLIFLSGFVLTVSPGKVGEVFKSLVLEKTHGIEMSRTAPIVIAERLTDVIAIVVLVAIGSTGFEGGLYWAAAGSAAVVFALALIFAERPAEFVFRTLEARRIVSRWVPKLRAGQRSLQGMTTLPNLVYPVALSVAGWGLEGFALHCLLDGFNSAPEFSFSLFFYATSTLAGALIPVPGGLGVTESILLQQLVHVGAVAVPVATASMLLIRLTTLWWAVVVGFVALAVVRLRFSRAWGASVV